MASLWTDVDEWGRGVGWECEEAPSAARREHQSACRPYRNCNPRFIGGRPWCGSDRVTPRRKPYQECGFLATSTASLSLRTCGAINIDSWTPSMKPAQLGCQLVDNLTGQPGSYSSAVRYGEITIWCISLSHLSCLFLAGAAHSLPSAYTRFLSSWQASRGCLDV
jgi:hypothetical protein